MARAIPTSLSGVVEHLELEGHVVVTLESLRDALGAAGVEDASDDQVRNVAYQLQRAGWLGTVRSRNAWEFLPGSRAGEHCAEDRFLEFRAYTATHPGWPGTLAMESAAGVHGLAQRFPEREVLVLPTDAKPPKTFARDWRMIASPYPSPQQRSSTTYAPGPWKPSWSASVSAQRTTATPRVCPSPYAANAAWVAMAVIAFNFARAAALPAGMTKARDAIHQRNTAVAVT